MVVPYEVLQWARQWTYHEFLPPTLISGLWTLSHLPGGRLDFVGSLGLAERNGNNVSKVTLTRLDLSMTDSLEVENTG